MGSFSGAQAAGGQQVGSRATLPAGLSERDLAVLEFERREWASAGAKEEAIRSQFGCSAARYYQVLNAVIGSPVAEAHDPILVRRLRRIRDGRRRS